MIRLTKKQIQEKELEMLLEFDRYCKENCLRYYLAGGTLLGAIRHHGFIPWDDDIDICMPRTDYEELLLKIINSPISSAVEVCEPSFNNLDVPFCKLFANNTMVINKFIGDIANSRLWIDIFPVDGLPDDLKEVAQVYKKCDFYRKMLLLCDAKLGEGTTSFRKWSKYILKPLSNIYGKKNLLNRLIEIGKTMPYKTSNYVGIVTSGLYGIGERMLKSEFEKAVEVEFEGHKFPAFSCWDSYLHGLYGDYMQLPPVEKRKTHEMEVYLLESEF